MKHVRKIFAFALTLVMALAVALPAFAQEVPSNKGGDATITIANAAKGETYTVYKIFNATVGSNGEITYSGTIPGALVDYFTKDEVGTIRANSKKTDAEIRSAVADYVNTLNSGEVASAESDGSSLTFTGLEYGYYGVTTTQGATVTVDSTNPNATIYDKNSKLVRVEKTVADVEYSIGDTIQYTAKIDTANYMGDGEDAQQVTKYIVSDTLPEFLTDVKIKSIKVVNGKNEEQTLTTQQFVDKQISIPWATEVANSNPKAYNSLYENGAKLVIVYEAKLRSVVNINTANTNTVTVTPQVWNGTKEEPWKDSYEDDAVIKTFAAAVKKVDENENPLPGAKFKVKGLYVTGSAGVYTVTSYIPNDANDSGTEMDTDANGMLYIIGLDSDVTNYSLIETVAPNGYNKLTEPTTLLVQQLTEAIYTESGERYFDAKGNLVSQSSSAKTTVTVEKNLSDLDVQAIKVVNQAGTELPSTGGIGTTIFYIVGGVMVAGAAIFLLTKRRAAASE